MNIRSIGFLEDNIHCGIYTHIQFNSIRENVHTYVQYLDRHIKICTSYQKYLLSVLVEKTVQARD